MTKDYKDALFDLDHAQRMVAGYLIKAQLEFWPGSKILTIGEVYRTWKIDGFGLSSALQYPCVIYYETPQGYRGIRYGVEGHEYLSGAYGGTLG